MHATPSFPRKWESSGKAEEIKNRKMVFCFYDMNGEGKRAERKGVDPRVRGDDDGCVRGDDGIREWPLTGETPVPLQDTRSTGFEYFY